MKQLLILILLTFVGSISAQKSFTLDEALAYAEENNRTLKAKKLDVEDANQEIKGVLSASLPQVTAGVDYQYYFDVPAQPIPDFITPSVYGVLFTEGVIPVRDLGDPEVSELSFFQPHNLTGKIDVNMLVYDGSYRYGVKASKMYKDLTKRQINASEYEIKTNVTKAYLNCLITKENIDIIDNNISVLAKSLNDTKATFEAGFAESLDVDRLQLSFDNLNTEKTNLLELLKLSKNLLKFQMGFPLNEDIELVEELDVLVDQFSITETDEVEVDYSKRPEFAVLELSEQLNDLDYKRNRAGYLPSVRAFASTSRSIQRKNLFNNDEAGLIPTTLAGLAINIPIYDGGEKKSKVQMTKINAERLRIQKEDFKSAVNLQVQNAKIALKNATNNIENRRKALEMNESIYERVNIKFTEGVGSSVEVSQAEASLFEAQAHYINALYDLVTAQSDLEIALGEL